MAQAKTVRTKGRKKNWYPLIAPSMFKNAVLGETFVYEEKAMMGKTITQNLMNLTGDIKKQNTNINFIVTDVKDGRALTDITGYVMIPASIKRLTRRRSEKIELSFTADTSDGKHVRIKPLIFAISNTRGSISNKIRNTAKDFLVKTIKEMTYDKLINELIDHKLQKSLRGHIRTIYPIRACQIKDMHIEKEKKHAEKRVKKAEPENKDVPKKEDKIEKKE